MSKFRHRAAFWDRLVGAVAVLLMAAAAFVAVFTESGCATTPGAPSAVSVASQAAAAGLRAYTDALATPGVTRADAFRAAENAAVAEASRLVPLAVAEEYRPLITAALLTLAMQLDAAKVSGGIYPSGDSVREAIQSAIERAK